MRITTLPDDVGWLTGASPGSIEIVEVDGQPRSIWSYDTFPVVKVVRIIVDP